MSAAPGRLAGAASGWLRERAGDPVDWLPWGREAVRRARSEDRPIFLSIGGSACYPCRVTARESFAEPILAEFMNRRFVNVAVDRLERPDVDEVYRAAVLLYAHQSGWPATLFLTPDLEPYFAGTYFSRADRLDGPGLVTVLHSMAEAWARRRDEVHEQARELGAAMRDFLGVRAAGPPPGPELARAALATLRERFDAENGGFVAGGGTAGAKFPQVAALHLLGDLAAEDAEAAALLDATLDAMARGGVRDHLVGGFHRHALDRAWRVPQFEKLLADNAHLLEVYARAAARRGDPALASVARETAAFLDRDLGGPGGVLVATLDLAPEGDDEPSHAWRRSRLDRVLGREEAAFFASLYGCDGPPFFERDYHVLHRPLPPAAQAARRRTSVEALEAELEPLREKLRRDRRDRERARRDEIVLADANGAAVAALATAGELLAEPALVERAATVAGGLLATLRPAGGPLHHAAFDGVLGGPAVLLDYAETVRGLAALARATGEVRWRATAEELAAEAETRLDDGAGGFVGAAADPALPFVCREVFDGAGPAALPQMALALVDLVAAGGERRWLERAASTLASAASTAAAHPESARTYARAALRLAALSPRAASRSA